MERVGAYLGQKDKFNVVPRQSASRCAQLETLVAANVRRAKRRPPSAASHDLHGHSGRDTLFASCPV